MGKTLIIAEKPSVAGDLAKTLGKFEKASDWFENDQYVISSAVGHLLELCAPEGVEVKRGKWSLVNLPVLPPEFDLRPIEKTESRLNVLKRLIKRKDIDAIINACDAGREGELIFRNLIAASKTSKPSKRLWLQSMTPTAIRDAFQHLRSDQQMQPLADAAVSRSESDWLVGINSTRALTAFNSKTGGFQKTTAGRVQTPTLAILVEREEKIRAFKERPYWEVVGDFGAASGSYRGLWFDPAFKKSEDEDAKAERLWDRSRAEAISSKCTGKTGIVEEEKKPASQISPQLYDLTTLQREANGRFGLPANRTLQIAQALYEKFKVLTYPRTDSRYLPEDYLATAKGVMGSFDSVSLSIHAEKALKNGWIHPNKRIFNNAKVSDHFAIVPTGTPPKGLDDLQMKIYEMVARRFIAVFYPAAQFEITTRITTVEQEKFKTNGKIIIDPGWMAVYGREAQGDDDTTGKAIVPVKSGEKVSVEAIEVRESMTKPAARYNEATLLSAMEGAGKLVEDEELREAMREKGLGTPATRASVIEGLIYEGYLERRGRELLATSKGISLITLLKNLKADVLTKPELTGEWEFRLKEMEHGRLSRLDFMTGIRSLTSDLVEKVKGFGENPIEGTFLTLEVTCPKCGEGPFKEDYRTWTCANCSLRIWKGVAGREFEPEEVKTLLTEKRVGPLEGFVSKMGRKFAAAIILDEEFKPTFEFAKKDDTDGEGGPDLSQAKHLGDTERGKIYETESAFLCVPEKQGAKPIRMGKTILQQNIPPDQALKIFNEGKTALFKRFISKKGKPFSAFLVLEGEKVGFEFEARKPRPAKAAAKK